MNYIKHLNSFFGMLEDDQRMTAYHVSLYVCIFHRWNLNRFRNPFPISREELMQLSGIGSTNTYARCMKQLDQWKYIEYSSKGNFHTGIKVSCIIFDTESDTETNSRNYARTNSRNDTLLKNNINKNKEGKRTPSNYFADEKRKNSKSINPYHVVIDKDYSEPL